MTDERQKTFVIVIFDLIICKICHHNRPFGTFVVQILHNSVCKAKSIAICTKCENPQKVCFSQLFSHLVLVEIALEVEEMIPEIIRPTHFAVILVDQDVVVLSGSPIVKHPLIGIKLLLLFFLLLLRNELEREETCIFCRFTHLFQDLLKIHLSQFCQMVTLSIEDYHSGVSFVHLFVLECPKGMVIRRVFALLEKLFSLHLRRSVLEGRRNDGLPFASGAPPKAI